MKHGPELFGPVPGFPLRVGVKRLAGIPSRTNIFTFPEAFENGGQWVNERSSISVNATAAPSGAVTADKLVEDSATGTHDVYGPVGVSAVEHTMSVYAKSAGRDWLLLYITVDASTFHGVFANLSTGALGTTIGTVTNVTITPAANGFYRVQFSKVLTAATWYCVFQLTTADGAAPESYAGDNASGVYLWGAKLEVGTPASIYP